MAVLIPTKKIPQLTAYGAPLAGSEMLEIAVLGTSRRITSRDFVLPIDSVITIAGMAGTLPGSRQLVSSATVLVVDGGAGGTVQLEAAATGAIAGNPTALIGLAPVNGVALTWMRSDAAPALDQSIAPVWTGNHSFRANQNEIRNAVAQLYFIESDAAADNQAWPIRVNSEQFNIGALNDLGSVFTPWVTVDRTGTVIDAIALFSTALTWNGSPLLSAATAFANPTASIGLAVVNGAATTVMRSDAAPALSQAIAPTWTAQHIFSLTGATNAAILASSAQPQIDWNETDAAANNRRWRFEAQGEQFLGRVVDDANSAAVTWMAIDRTLNVIDTLSFTVGSNTVSIQSSLISSTQQFRSTENWALNNLLNYGFLVASANPALALQETDAAANNAIWDIAAINEQLVFRTVSDGVVAAVNWMAVDRTGTTVDLITLSAPVSFTASSTATVAAVTLSNANPQAEFFESDAAANNRRWNFTAEGEQLRFRALSDDGLTVNNWLTVDRTGATIDLITLPAPVTHAGFSLFTRTAVGGTVNDVSVAISAAAPILALNETSAAANNRLWEISAQAEQLLFRAYTDDGLTLGTAIQVDRTGATIDQILLAATTLRFNTTTATTVGAAGGASALPATPTGYLTVNVNGTAQKIPYYAT